MQALKEAAERGENDSVGIAFSIVGNQMAIVYTDRQPVDPKLFERYSELFDTHIDELTEATRAFLDTAEKAGGVEGVYVSITYLNTDGALIWTHNFS